MARNEREAIAIVLDVGLAVSEDKDENGTSFFDRARGCASHILQRKLFGNSNDLVGLLLLGTEVSNNSLDYPNIAIQFQMAETSWDLLKFVEEEIKPTNVNGDWLDAITVGMQFIKDEMEGSSFLITSKKLVIFTNFSAPASDDEVNLIMAALRKLQIELIVIGPNLIQEVVLGKADVKLEPSGVHANESQNLIPEVVLGKADVKLEPSEVHANGSQNIKPEVVLGKADVKLEPSKVHANGSQSHEKSKTVAQESGEALISRIVTEVNGIICSFDDAAAQLQYFETKKIKPAPWNVVMDIGPDIRIAVTSYKKVANVSLPSWTTESATLETETGTDHSYFKQDAEQKNVSDGDVISGYTFGSTIVPFAGIDEAQLQYKSGEKCLSVICTTQASKIHRQLLVGDGCHYVVAQSGDCAAAVALSAFTQALHEERLVALARKVYNNNCAPTVGVLYPKLKPYECLVFVELAFGRDVRHLKFPSLKNIKVSQPQENAIDNLITHMALTTAAEDDEVDEAFCPEHALDPYHQHFYQALCNRGLNPDGPLLPVSQTTLDLLETPFKDDMMFNAALIDVKENFELTVIPQKEPRKTAADIFQQDDEVLPGAECTADAVLGVTTMADMTASTTVQIGTVNPVLDFAMLLEKNVPLRDAAMEMKETITKLVLGSFGSDEYDKALLAVNCLRDACILADQPEIFNNWLVEFKEKTMTRGITFFQRVVEEKLGQITSTETASSLISADTATSVLQDQPFDLEELLSEM